MFGMQGWQLVIVAAIIVLLFGAKRLPQMARGLGQSLKIFKAETKGLIEDSSDKDDSVAGSAPEKKDAQTESPVVEPTTVDDPSEPVNESTRRDA